MLFTAQRLKDELQPIHYLKLKSVCSLVFALNINVDVDLNKKKLTVCTEITHDINDKL